MFSNSWKVEGKDERDCLNCVKWAKAKIKMLESEIMKSYLRDKKNKHY